MLRPPELTPGRGRAGGKTSLGRWSGTTPKRYVWRGPGRLVEVQGESACRVAPARLSLSEVGAEL
ncbi:hypothetical protein GGP94_001330 [Salinibacter ruber]|uniref:Uncharacterized protein n=1 Tax=Salinibacter ruber TaxID=146919 RepID=A0A9X2VBF0_9BACT|nr:hypothetical protein [Salinibacter ruber]MCS3705607.1 hypothetical protein [Salinibacter ruber]MCS4057708.1 hypothetical protein [Salinibacter ruber]MCS4059766.1 hypothetical protein [Salinibacter ruber]MCS4086590.1 hypothetical protein [Salinibacter ruber]